MGKFRSPRYRDPNRPKPRSPWVPQESPLENMLNGTVRGQGTVKLPCVWCGKPSSHNLRYNGSKAIKICSVCVADLPEPLPKGTTLKLIGR